MTENQSPKRKRQSLKEIARRVSTVAPPPSAESGTKPPPRSPLDSTRPVAVSTPPDPPKMEELAAMCEAAASKILSEPPRDQDKRPSRLRAAAPIIGGLAVGVGAIILATVVVTRGGVTERKPFATPAAAPPAATESQTSTDTKAAKTSAKQRQPNAEAPAKDAPTTEAPATAAPPAEAPKTNASLKASKISEPTIRTEPKSDGKKDDDGTAGTRNADEPDEQPKGLSEAMAAAVGDNGRKADKTDTDNSDESRPNSRTMPMAPSQGQVQAALGQVRSAARACVEGLEGPSRATVTFVASGRVSSVSVSGAASGTPAASCIRSAIQNARVPPFKKSSYTVGITLRP